ncbi:MAG TPA: alpha/beta hydrolase, partial [Chloroflexota bacterium]
MADQVANQVASARAPRRSSGAREAVTHRRVQTNGIGMHVAEAGTGPLVVLVHGFPELWYSWRHQLPLLAAAGYHAVAPDLRGYGGSDAPEADEGYAPSNMAADLVGLLDVFGADTAVLVGHDWGANIAWACAELHPGRVAALVALSVPYRPRPPVPPTEALRQFAPDKSSASPYPLGVTEAELETDARRSLRLFFHALSGDAPPELVPRLFKERAAPGRVLDSMPEPDKLPAWLSEADLDQYAEAYARTGFRGALGIYRNQDRDWEQHPEIGTTGVKQPALFIGGRRDPAVLFGKLEPDGGRGAEPAPDRAAPQLRPLDPAGAPPRRQRRAPGVRAAGAVVVSGAAADGAPWMYYDLGHGDCTHPYFSQCPHRLICAKCSFYRPKAEMAAFVEQAKGNLLRLREELPLTEEERAVVDDDLTGYEHLLAQLADVPALDGATPRQLMSQGATLVWNSHGDKRVGVTDARRCSEWLAASPERGATRRRTDPRRSRGGC